MVKTGVNMAARHRLVRVRSGWRVVSKKGKNLGTFRSKKKASRRLRQVEFFKRRK